MPELPQKHLSEMKELLQDEYDDYLASFENKRVYGLRINTSKISVRDFLKINPFHLERIPWTDDGFYYDEEDRPAKHPYYFAGLYYLQEPSAMLPAEVLPVEENDLVLDCCAAPGGKSSKLANKLNNTGVLIANDISASRAQVLLKTLESQGIRNAYVMAEDITKIERFKECFDKILIDAPCSGEGMFRKESELISSWEERNSDYYSPIQKQLILKGVEMLKSGGKLVYSTCTFSPEEDEEIIEYALDKCPELKTLPIKKYEGFVSGITDKTKNCVRLYPHRIKGEGHFVALLQKGEDKQNSSTTITNIAKPQIEFFRNIDMNFNNGSFVQRKEKLYFEPDLPFDIKGLRIMRSGLLLGTFNHDRFEPSQALAAALKYNEYKNTLNFTIDDERILKYLKCETLDVRDRHVEGMVLVCVDSYPLGFGKVSKGILKNLYPANYRYR
ncbi:MAG: RsmB/NOP family class I SAM-dependent RNA methyltransferase [Erysipelotrichaceae bacterium]|nr:RsmB/NOP family class I SAM-dependent RNA methyltransferase [Erysipelotrichaceae bacterium]